MPSCALRPALRHASEPGAYAVFEFVLLHYAAVQPAVYDEARLRFDAVLRHKYADHVRIDVNVQRENHQPIFEHILQQRQHIALHHAVVAVLGGIEEQHRNNSGIALLLDPVLQDPALYQQRRVRGLHVRDLAGREQYVLFVIAAQLVGHHVEHVVRLAHDFL